MRNIFETFAGACAHVEHNFCRCTHTHTATDCVRACRWSDRELRTLEEAAKHKPAPSRGVTNKVANQASHDHAEIAEKHEDPLLPRQASEDDEVSQQERRCDAPVDVARVVDLSRSGAVQHKHAADAAAHGIVCLRKHSIAIELIVSSV